MSTTDRIRVLSQLGATVRTLRRQEGLSQEALAELAGLDRTYVGSIERGERNVSLLNLARLAAALETSLPELLTDIPPLRKDDPTHG